MASVIIKLRDQYNNIVENAKVIISNGTLTNVSYSNRSGICNNNHFQNESNTIQIILPNYITYSRSFTNNENISFTINLEILLVKKTQPFIFNNKNTFQKCSDYNKGFIYEFDYRKGIQLSEGTLNINASLLSELPSIVTPGLRQYHQQVTLQNGNILMFGGDDYYTSVRKNDTWIYNIETSNWELQNPTNRPSARAFHGMTLLGNGKVLLFGGEGGSGDTWIYDPTDSNWHLQAISNPPDRNRYYMTTMKNGNAFLFGGYYWSPMNDTWIYNIQTSLWEQLFPVNSPSARYVPSIATLGNGNILLFGGYPSTKDTWIYNLQTSNWEQQYPVTVPTYPLSFYARQMVTLQNGNTFVLGDNGSQNSQYWFYDYINNNWVTDSLLNNSIMVNSDQKTSNYSISILNDNKVTHYGGDGVNIDKVRLIDFNANGYINCQHKNFKFEIQDKWKLTNEGIKFDTAYIQRGLLTNLVDNSWVNSDWNIDFKLTYLNFNSDQALFCICKNIGYVGGNNDNSINLYMRVGSIGINLYSGSTLTNIVVNSVISIDNEYTIRFGKYGDVYIIAVNGVIVKKQTVTGSLNIFSNNCTTYLCGLNVNNWIFKSILKYFEIRYNNIDYSSLNVGNTTELEIVPSKQLFNIDADGCMFDENKNIKYVNKIPIYTPENVTCTKFNNTIRVHTDSVLVDNTEYKVFDLSYYNSELSLHQTSILEIQFEVHSLGNFNPFKITKQGESNAYLISVQYSDLLILFGSTYTTVPIVVNTKYTITLHVKTDLTVNFYLNGIYKYNFPAVPDSVFNYNFDVFKCAKSAISDSSLHRITMYLGNQFNLTESPTIGVKYFEPYQKYYPYTYKNSDVYIQLESNKKLKSTVPPSITQWTDSNGLQFAGTSPYGKLTKNGIYFDGSQYNRYSKSNININFNVDFTIQLNINFSVSVSQPSQKTFFTIFNSGNGSHSISLYTISGIVYMDLFDGSNTITFTIGQLTYGSNFHLACVRYSNTIYFYVNGILKLSSAFNYNALNFTSSTMLLGTVYNGSLAFIGYIDNFYINNSAVYTNIVTIGKKAFIPKTSNLNQT